VRTRLKVAFCLLAAVVSAACQDQSVAVATLAPPQIIASAEAVPLPNHKTSIKFAVIGDSGRWSGEQRETASRLASYRATFAFDFVLMLGDNNYGDGSPQSYVVRFEEPYKPVLDEGVKFYAARGNHDAGTQWNYPPFNMGGNRYYTFEKSSGVLPGVKLGGDKAQFFAMDTVKLDRDQLAWLDRELSRSKADWKIVFQHHPLYSSGRYSLSAGLFRRTLEQSLIEHSADVVFAGHEHLYERLMPQRGVMYFISGAAGSVRTGDLPETSPVLAKGYDRDLSFMLLEIDGETMFFQTINRVGETVDSGKIVRRKAS
jgi:hypothetical protein